MRTSGITVLWPKPNLHRTGPGGRKKHIKRGAKGLSVSPTRVYALSLSHAMGRSSRVFGLSCPHAPKMDFLAVI